MKTFTPDTLHTRLTMWKLFFETERDTTPDDATNDGYDLDVLIDQALKTDEVALRGLAELVQLQKQSYLACSDWKINEMFCGDMPYPIWNPAKYRTHASPTITMDELDEILKPR